MNESDNAQITELNKLLAAQLGPGYWIEANPSGFAFVSSRERYSNIVDALESATLADLIRQIEDSTPALLCFRE